MVKVYSIKNHGDRGNIGSGWESSYQPCPNFGEGIVEETRFLLSWTLQAPIPPMANPGKVPDKLAEPVLATYSDENGHGKIS